MLALNHKFENQMLLLRAIMKKILILLLILTSATGFTQNTFGVGASIGLLYPESDWSSKFGNAYNSQVDLVYQHKSKWLFTLGGGIMFGNNVKIDPISSYRGNDGFTFGDNNDGQGTFSNVELRFRGYEGRIMAGYQYQIPGYSYGIRGLIGPNYIFHKIRIQDDANISTPSLAKEYKKGFDRARSGFGGTIEIGPYFTNSSGSFTFFALGSFSYNNTSTLRSLQFDVNTQNEASNSDSSWGAKVGVNILFIKIDTDENADNIYY